MLRKIIRGELKSVNPKIEAYSDEFYINWQKICFNIDYSKHLKVLTNYDREWYGEDSVWSQKGSKKTTEGIEFNSPSPAWEDRQSFINFLNALKELTETEEAVALGLEGFLEITMETAKFPLVIRVKIEDGKVSYQEAESVVWGAETTV